MFDNTMTLDDHLQRQVDHGISGLDIMHGYLKVLMLEAEKELEEAQQIEEDNDYDDAMESMERKYWEGQVDAISHLYSLTYALSFAIMEKTKETENA
jgi:HPt (histidine-containing phosphotransfer) domain-containing protein